MILHLEFDSERPAIVFVSDRSMQLNEGRFGMNGRCGYVLQPECMRNPKYNPYDKHTLTGVDPITLCITVNIRKDVVHLFTDLCCAWFSTVTSSGHWFTVPLRCSWKMPYKLFSYKNAYIHMCMCTCTPHMHTHAHTCMYVYAWIKD